MRLRDDIDLEDVVHKCKSAGVIVGAGDDYFPAEPTGKFLRLNYAGSNAGEFPDAARTIGSVI
jgi:DNA-binding transcriptional MocR family regulator